MKDSIKQRLRKPIPDRVLWQVIDYVKTLYLDWLRHPSNGVWNPYGSTDGLANCQHGDEGDEASTIVTSPEDRIDLHETLADWSEHVPADNQIELMHEIELIVLLYLTGGVDLSPDDYLEVVDQFFALHYDRVHETWWAIPCRSLVEVAI